MPGMPYAHPAHGGRYQCCPKNMDVKWALHSKVDSSPLSYPLGSCFIGPAAHRGPIVHPFFK